MKENSHGKLDMSIFDPFDVAQWPTTQPLIDEYVAGNIWQFSELVNVDFDVQLQLEFEALVSELLTSTLYCTTRKSSAFDFWTGVLNNYAGKLSGKLKWVIQSVVVIPYRQKLCDNGGFFHKNNQWKLRLS